MATTAAAPSVDVTPEKLGGLRRFNAIMGLVHLVQGLFMILVSNDTTYPIFTNYLSFDLETFSLSPNPQLLFELRFGPAVAAFLLISAVAHGYLATIGFARYSEHLRRGMNPVRFVYWLWSSIMMPKRFMVALSVKISKIAPRSHRPVSMPNPRQHRPARPPTRSRTARGVPPERSALLQ